MIIGLIGYARTGKDTFYQILANKHPGIYRVAFADPIKRAVSEATGYSVEYIEKHKDEVAPEYGVTFRTMLQTLGTEWARGHNDNWWLIRAKNEISKFVDKHKSTVIVTDVRFYNEVEALKEMGAIICRIKHTKITGQVLTHESEKYINSLPYDTLISNDGVDLYKYEKDVLKVYEICKITSALSLPSTGNMR